MKLSPLNFVVKSALPTLTAALAVGVLLLSTPPAHADGPVVVEMFTSEGCSSCPPADALLARYARAGSVAGIPVIALGEHVDYWDGASWRDPFSQHQFSQRQEAYARALNARVETPQIVVDGYKVHDGGSANLDRQAILQAAQAPKATVGLTISRRTVSGRTLVVSVSHLPPSAGRGPVDVLLAVTEDGLSSQVRGGENAGHRLDHGAVVRRLSLLGTVAQGTFAGTSLLTLAPSWQRGHLHAVVFVQARDSHRIVGAAQVGLGEH